MATELRLHSLELAMDVVAGGCCFFLTLLFLASEIGGSSCAYQLVQCPPLTEKEDIAQHPSLVLTRRNDDSRLY